MAYTKNVREIVDELRIANREQFNCLLLEYKDDPREGVVRAIEVAARRLEKADQERARVEKMYEPMRKAGENKIVVGVDEVGRGPLAGPLAVAAVVLPCYPIIEGLNDSKKLTARERENLAKVIDQRARALKIVFISPKEIDETGITASLRKAMQLAIDGLSLEPDLVLIDGNSIGAHSKEKCIVKGDSKVACIAAASIVAKVARDKLMVEADKTYPGYFFAQNKGYGSSQHIEAIKKLGTCQLHRETFCSAFTQPRLF